MRGLFLIAIAGIAATGCHPEPDISCDRERLFVALDDVEVDTSADVDPEREGIQIDLTVNSTLNQGALGVLFVVDAEGEETPFDQTSTADDEGRFFFDGVTLPPGRILLVVRSAGECRAIETTRELFVFDEMGRPSCVLSFATEPEVRDLIDQPVLDATADDDLSLDDLQTSIRVETGRSDVDVRLLIRDVANGDEQILEEQAGEDSAVELEVTLGQGVQSVRAICTWVQFPDVPLISPTKEVFVDTIAPGCSLVAPAAAVGAGDDLDGDPSNGIQFAMVGQVSGADAEGAEARFSAGIQVFDGTAIASDGTSTATGTVPNPPPSPQNFGFTAEDRAGNTCEDSASF